MRILFAVAILAFLTGASLGQPKQETKTPAQLEGEKAAERAYQRSLGNIPDKVQTDPWGAVRSPDAPKTSPGHQRKAGADMRQR